MDDGTLHDTMIPSIRLVEEKHKTARLRVARFGVKQSELAAWHVIGQPSIRQLDLDIF